jgi:hypothetical protein
LPCWPSSGNWVNAATKSCQTSGGTSIKVKAEKECETKRS